mmetsp:Transcript_6479/g.19543  ORF Transcript_6479/g.19543 Transcript_6479/m.19543 type:complete len:307 (-) Transcript_6479:240-1160(-)
MPASSDAVAIPDPMSPPPMTATVPSFLLGTASLVPSDTPLTFFVPLMAKKMLTRALCAGSLAASLKAAVSAASPALPPFSTPASMASMHRSGCWTFGALFLVCSLAIPNIIFAMSFGSSLSSRSRVLTLFLFPEARSRATALAVASSSCGVFAISSTRPREWALAPLTDLEVKMSSRPVCKPTRRGRRWVPPKPGMIPSWSSGKPILASGVHTLALQAAATSHPPPRATPWMAATVGFAPSSKTRVRIWLAPLTLSFTFSGDCAANCAMSNPAQKFLPLPVITTAFTSVLEWHSSSRFCNAESTSG